MYVLTRCEPLANPLARWQWENAIYDCVLTEQSIQEHLSRRFVQLIANRAGFICTTPEDDFGVDLDVTRVSEMMRNGKRRLLNSGQTVQLQLKATCEDQLSPAVGGVRYDLEAKTYNDLVERRNGDSLTPLYLILFVLPVNRATWLGVTPAELTVRRAAYWYRPNVGTPTTNNANTFRITIPDAQVLDATFVDWCFGEAYP